MARLRRASFLALLLAGSVAAFAQQHGASFLDLRHATSGSFLSKEFVSNAIGYLPRNNRWQESLDGLIYLTESKPDGLVCDAFRPAYHASVAGGKMPCDQGKWSERDRNGSINRAFGSHGSRPVQQKGRLD